MKRSEADPKYCWRLQDIFESNDKWEEAFREAQRGIELTESYKGKIAASSDEMYELFRKREKHLHLMEKLYVYAKMHKDEDTGNTLYQGMTDRAYQLLVAEDAAGAYIVPEILEIPREELLKRAAEPRFSDYRFSLEKIDMKREHFLSEKEEKLLSMAENALGEFHNIFTMLNDADLKFGEIKDENGNPAKLTHGTYSQLIRNADRRVRKDAYTKYYEVYRGVKNTISANYIASVKKDVFYAKARKYEGAVEAALAGGNVPLSVYEQLIEAVHEKLPALHKYLDLRKKQFKLDTLEFYDLYTPLVPECEIKMDYEEAKATVKEALKPLGDEYQQLLDKAFSEGWIDVYENEGKRSGAYSWGVYGTHPYVFLNHQNDINHASTLAHELGHAMHTYFSDREQPYETAGYSIMVAEVASTVNEVLMTRYLLKNVKDSKQKAYILNEFLETVRATCYRQTMFAEFELKAHRLAEQGEALTVDVLSKIYSELNEQYYQGVNVDENIALEWMRIPHFYRAFYVYQYATGICSAIAIANSILERGETKQYFDFLSSGGSDFPVELLKKAGVDLTDKRSILNALDVFDRSVDELKELLEA